MKKKIRIFFGGLIIILLSVFFLRWYMPFHDVKKWGVSLPYSAKPIETRDLLDFQGQGSIMYIFDVSNCVPQIEKLIRDKKFKKCKNEELVYLFKIYNINEKKW